MGCAIFSLFELSRANSRINCYISCRVSETPDYPHEISDPLDDIVRRHRAGEPVGIVAVCSAHPLVIEAAMVEAVHSTGPVLIEATSNQVDQTGGYTQMRPPDFQDLVRDIARRTGVPEARLILGGDHLGPNRWRELPPDAAMVKAEELVAAYVTAGFTKIHLDCSMPCRGDTVPLSDEVVSERATRLMQVAEESALPQSPLSYVIGTEVPAPGGATDDIAALEPTSARAAARTLRAHCAAVAERGLDAAWTRVRALVVQPGVEFDHLHVVDYDGSRTQALEGVLDDEPNMVFEAHSTDYQTPARLRELVEHHWAVLKVGPALTFAMREALVGLAAIEKELVPPAHRSRLLKVIEERMLAKPGHWERYYAGDAASQRLARRYSFSDRVRYYWSDPEVQRAQTQLLDNLTETGIPLPLLSQHLPEQYARVRDGVATLEARSLVIDRVKGVLRGYAAACNTIESRARGQFGQLTRA